jgi:hypothetical protein
MYDLPRSVNFTNGIGVSWHKKGKRQIAQPHDTNNLHVRQ